MTSSNQTAYLAISFENSANASVLFDTAGTATYFGNTAVFFVNLDNLSIFSATYYYTLNPGAIGVGWTMGSSAQIGLQFSVVDSNNTPGQVANSYTKKFSNYTAGVNVLALSIIYSDSWNGFSVGPSVSAGAAVTNETTYYMQTSGPTDNPGGLTSSGTACNN